MGVMETTNGHTIQNHKDLGSFEMTYLDGVEITISSENYPHMDQGLLHGLIRRSEPQISQARPVSWIHVYNIFDQKYSHPSSDNDGRAI